MVGEKLDSPPPPAVAGYRRSTGPQSVDSQTRAGGSFGAGQGDEWRPRSSSRSTARSLPLSFSLFSTPLKKSLAETTKEGRSKNAEQQEQQREEEEEEEDYRTTKEMGSAEREGAGGGGEAEGVRENGGMKQQEGIRKLVVGVCVMEKKVREQDEEEEEEDEEEEEEKKGS